MPIGGCLRRIDMRNTGAERPAYALGGARLGKRVTAVTARLRRRACPNHWSFLFGPSITIGNIGTNL